MFRHIGFILLSILTLSVVSAIAESELICHTSDVSECYPKLFEATDEFRVVQDDQDLPPGLHVRLDIQTGKKEAKLYDGNDEDLANTVEVFPDGQEGGREGAASGSDIFPVGDVVDETPQALDPPPADYSPPAVNDQIPIPPELLQHVLASGDRTIKRPAGGDADSEAFTSALGALTSADSSAEAILTALSTLEDLAHDIYWGLTLAKSDSGVRAIASHLRNKDVEVSSTAALALGNTVHNNPKALNLTLTHLPTLPLEVRSILAEKVDEHSVSTLPARQYTRLLFLLSSLLSGSGETNYIPSEEADGLYGLLQSDHLDALLAQFNAAGAGSGDGWDRPRQAISDLILDRIVGPEPIKQFTELMWRVWEARDGYSGGGLGAAWTKDNVLRDETAVEQRGGADAGWKKIYGGKGQVLPFWIRAPAEDARHALKKSPQPRKFSEAFEKQLVSTCRTFEEALSNWERLRTGGSSDTAEEHVREAHKEVTARLAEVGCRCSGCAQDGAAASAREKTEL